MNSPKDIEFTAIIDPDGTLSYEYEAEDEAEMRGFIRRLEADKPTQIVRAPVPASEAISVDEAAALLDLDRNTLYEALARGEGPPARRIGRIYRLARCAVLEWLRSGEPPRVRGRRGGR